MSFLQHAGKTQRGSRSPSSETEGSGVAIETTEPTRKPRCSEIPETGRGDVTHAHFADKERNTHPHTQTHNVITC